MQLIKLKKVKLFNVLENIDSFTLVFDITFDFNEMDVEERVKEGLKEYVFSVRKERFSDQLNFAVYHDRAYEKYNWVAKCCNKRGGGRCPHFEQFGEEIFNEVQKDETVKEFFKKNRLRFIVGGFK